MKLKIFSSVCFIIFSMALLSSCEKDYKTNDASPPVVPPSASWLEGFTDIGSLGTKGWIISNLSDRPGLEGWRRGRYESTNKFTFGSDYVVGFPAYVAERTPNDFISCDMYAGTTVANLSVWLFTPVTKIKNGDQLVFYTRSHLDDGSFSIKDGNDRMQVRANYLNTSTNAGGGWNTVGDFTNLLTDINASLAVGGYPQEWTKYTLTVTGVAGTINGRFAFRYFVTNGGPDGNNSALVGVDEVSFISK